MGSVVMLAAGLVAVTGGVTRFASARSPVAPATRYLCAAVIAAGLSAALSAPAVLAAAARVEPSPNFTRLVVNGIGMVAAWCLHSLLTHLVTDDPVRARRAVRIQAVILVSTIAAMSALFLSADLTYRPDFLNAFADRPPVYGYLVLFSGYVGWSMARFVHLLGRYLHLTDRRWLQVGMRTMRAGAAFGVGWALHKLVATTAVFLTGSPYPGSDTLAWALPAACVALVAVGVCVPVCAPVLARATLCCRRHVQYRRLRHLWTTLQPVIAEVRHTTVRGSIHERLSARVVDILDALLVLTPYRRDGAPRRRGGAADPGVEAALIVDALRRWRDGAAPSRGAVPGPAPTVDDLDGEIAWLARVARSLRRAHAAPPDRNRTVSGEDRR